MKRYKGLFNRNPEALIFSGFLLAIVIGAILLKLPVSSARHPLSGIDALFMATSAVCVTGLTVADVGKDLTLFGQLVILTLIQIGGLGIMTFSLLFLVLIGKRISLSSQLCLPALTQDINLQNVKFALFFILSMTLTIELFGAVLLFLNLRTVHPLPFAVYSSIFHAISAFCNSGFSLYSDSFIRFHDSPLVLITLMGLIIIGGLGFLVIYELLSFFPRRGKPSGKLSLSLHTRIALIGSAALIFLGAGLIWLLESNNVLAGMTPAHRVLNAIFLSVTSRTAGFNTLSVAQLSNPALLLVITLMFIGGCPGSTAGGIKVHVFLTLVAHIHSKIRGLFSTNIFKRKIPDHVVDRGLTIFIYGTMLVLVAVFVLQITENTGHTGSVTQARERFLDTYFEATSAFGTVGLSTGLTRSLTVPGKAIIIILMFIGRIGPMTLGVALQMQQRRKIIYEFPKEEIMIN